MTSRDTRKTTLVGTILEEEVEHLHEEVGLQGRLSAERVIELAEEGVIEPIGRNPASWRFRGVSLRRIRCAQRLEQDLGLNTAGVALVLDLLEELEELRTRLGRIEA